MNTRLHDKQGDAVSMLVLKVVCIVFASLFSILPALASQTGNVMHTPVIQLNLTQIEIVVATNAPDSVRLAAEELRSYLNLMKVSKPQTAPEEPGSEKYRIYVGDSDFARENGVAGNSLPHDGFRVKTTDKWMIISGKDYAGPPLVGFNNPWRLHESYNDDLKLSAFGDAGTLQGVYYFLRQIAGIRWYMPGPLGTVIPTCSTLSLTPGIVDQSPAFEHRHPYYCFFSTSKEDALWYRRAGFGTPAPVQITHSLGHFFNTYKDTHPEYFALIDGKRDFTTLSTIVGPGNYELTSKEFQAAVVKEINTYFDANPNQLIFPLSPNDGMMRISDTPEAQRQITPERGELGKFSNYFWGFVDQVAREVYKTHPDKLIGSLAYEAYTLPPTSINKLSPNVAVMYCKTRGNFTDAAYKEKIRQGLTDWKAKTANLYCWEYYNNIIDNSSWRGYPIFYPQIIQEDVRWLHTLGTKGEFIEAESWRSEDYSGPGMTKINYPGLQHLNLYLTSRLLCNSDLDVRKELDEYYRLFYGPAEADMRRFWELAEKAWMNKGSAKAPSQVYSSEVLQAMLTALKSGATSVPPESDYAQRIRQILDEFKPVAQMQKRLEKLRHPKVTVPSISEQETVPLVLWDKSPLLTLVDRSYVMADVPTHVRMLHTSRDLLIEIVCFEPDLSKVRAGAKAKDQTTNPPIWEDDSIEILFSEKCSSQSPGVQFIVNSRGALLDARLDPATSLFNPSWDSGATVSATQEGGKWVIHLQIPLKSLPIHYSPMGDGTLALNIYRNRFAGDPYLQSSWAPLLGGRYFNPEEYGILKLDK